MEFTIHKPRPCRVGHHQGPVIVADAVDQRNTFHPLALCAAVWSGSGMHTDTPTIRAREVPQRATALQCVWCASPNAQRGAPRGGVPAGPVGSPGVGARRPQPWVVVGYRATALKALMALVFWWPWIVIIRTLAEEVPQAHRGRAYGFHEAWDTAGAVLGPVAALLLVATLGSRTLLAWSAVPGALGVVVVLWWVRDHRPPQPHAALRTAVSPAYWRGLVALAHFQVGWVAPTLFILRVERAVPYHRVVTASLLYVVFNVCYAACAYPAGIWADKIGAGTVLGMAGALGVLTLAGFARPGVHVVLWGLMFAAAGAVTAGWESARQPWMLHRMTPGERGRAFGRVEASLGVSQLIGTVALAGVWTLVGPTWAFALAALMAAQGTFSLWSARRTAPPRADGCARPRVALAALSVYWQALGRCALWTPCH